MSATSAPNKWMTMSVIARPLAQVAFFCLTPESMIEAGRTKFNADYE
jgi:hypothetical protein